MRAVGGAEVQHCRTALEQDELPLLKQLGFVQIRNHDEDVQLFSQSGAYTPPPYAADSSSLRLRGSPDPNAGPDRLASFLSKLKYLYDETDHVECGPHVPGGPCDKRAAMKAQAVRVRNQLELKFRAIPLTMQAQSYIEGYKPTASRRVYNPLQTIRDRQFRPKPKRAPPLLWDVSVTEQIQDLRWRYQTMRVQSQSMRVEKPRKRSRDIAVPMPEPKREFLAPAPAPRRRSSMLARLEAGGSSELIARLQSRHDSADADTDTDTDAETAHTRRPTFCRNAAHVAETWNRLYRTTTQRTADSEACVSDVAKVASRSSSDESSPRLGADTRPRLTITDVDGSELSTFLSHANGGAGAGAGADVGSARASPSATASAYASANASASALAPAGSVSWTLGANASVSSDVGSLSPPNTSASSAAVARVPSPRKRQVEYHRAPWEVSVCGIEDDLQYLRLLYQIALDRGDLLKRLDRRCCARFRAACTPLGDGLQRATSPALAQYLEEVESDLATLTSKIEQGVATQVDAVRTATDLIVCEVNTTLNKDLRNVTSRMEKAIVCRSSTLSTHLCYTLIEYSLLLLMWVIWGGLKIWRLVLAVVAGVRYVCLGLAA